MKIFFLFLILFSFPVQATDWETFKNRFVRADGSVIDVQNDNRSHSEGQGYGMLLAVRYNDRETFKRIKGWTDRVLGKGLKAWLAEPDGAGYRILDYNSATDGDILITYALLQAFEKWGDEAYKNEALKNLQLIKTEAVKNDLILPGKSHFLLGQEIVLNPSYFIFPAISVFASYDDLSFWGRVYEKGLIFIKKMLQTPLQLPPDWIVYMPDGNFRAYQVYPFRFGYDAIRVPLYLGMASETETLSNMAPFFKLIKADKRIPEYVYFDPFEISQDSGNAGYYAVFAYAAAVMGDNDLAEKLFLKAKEKIENEKDNYYSNVLFLLAWPNG